MKTHPFKPLVALLLLVTGFITARAQSHLLLSEVTLTPSAGEFIEIYNPTNTAISLQGYYVADNSSYAGLPEGGLMIGLGDFIAAFPVGYTIQPNQTIVVAMGAIDFSTEYAVSPDFEIISQSALVPDMVNTGGSGTPALTNAGEAVVLFYWDGVSDLIKDVDIVYAGVPTSGNMLPSKTSVSIDGPDADAVASTFLADAATLPVQSSAPGAGYSTKRILPETGYEISTGGNGITGNDETSENTAITWDSVFTAPNPGISELFTGIPELNTAGNIKFFPNPTFGLLTIENNGYAVVSITGIDGKLIYRQQVTGTCHADLSGLAAGTYFVFLQTAKTVLTAKVIKE